jgi:hypothetical protein
VRVEGFVVLKGANLLGKKVLHNGKALFTEKMLGIHSKYKMLWFALDIYHRER